MLDRSRHPGDRIALFTNGSHLAPAAFARELRAVGLPVDDEQVLTPLCSVQAYLDRFRGEARVLPFATEPARAYLEEAGVHLVDGRNGEHVDAVLVAHTDEIDFERLERAARAVIAGARLLTGSYVPAYAGANGPILSRGAMITAAIAKASSARPIVVGKPSRAAVREMERRLGVPATGDRRRRRRRPPRGGARPSRRLDDDPRPQRHQRLARPLPRSGERIGPT